MRTFTKRLAMLAAAAVVALPAGAATAQSNYPAKPIYIVSSFPPGSISDTLSRVVGEKMGRDLGQSVVVENKPGANGAVGAIYVARAKPDGYTLLMGTNSINAINPSLFKQLNYAPEKDFAPIGMVAEIPAVLVARKGYASGDLAATLADARKRGATMSIATGTATAQVAAAMLGKKAGVKVLNVPYRGEPLGLTDLLGGQVDLMILNLPVAYSYIKNGQIKGLAILADKRAPALPDLPSISESLPGFSIPTGWNALFAPAGTPPAIVRKLAASLAQALKQDDVRKQIEAAPGTMVSFLAPDALTARVEADTRQWAEMIRAAGIEPQ